MWIQSCCALLLTQFIFVTGTLVCDNDTHYNWTGARQCCKKCQPGEFMLQRCSEKDETQCKPCGTDYYIDYYNVERSCEMCSRCTKMNMIKIKECTSKSNTVCGCSNGYKCNNEQCDECVIVQGVMTTASTTTTTTTTTTTRVTQPSAQSVNTNPIPDPIDSVWISLSLCCTCFLLTCFILISRHTPASGRTLSASNACCYWTTKKSSVDTSECTEEEEEEEEVPMPVQEMCGGKCDWQNV
ncbi:tumor necrosis factor receptor superfamily member 1B [Hoplias malabaricus]|uniref:tumor necrosis factor receptor superfamily member 1B n=1 Tax=Hoplias malabaricus TaxID=27720 RepID=UPI003461F8B5